ncbi:Hint domain-containing protein [Aliiruegeria haliotis]|uniref:Hint domain-containing protein n=1 Tax=Aliiruegeria haliotis TaxID=1280846 RepID=A0A2T0RZ96_9RHOB|nr:Hint domain-containing protein [Aliiruegeria haliotis]PRY26497.1 Hint domain-containing protein [Aliiruegeria haliotis]
MENLPRQAFGRARPVLSPRQTPRPFVLAPDLLEEQPPALVQDGAWLVSAVAAETRIMTPDGPRSAGLLAPGDQVLTLDHGALPLLWVGHRTATPAQIAERPDIGAIEIPAHAIAGGEPRLPLRVSPQAGILLDLAGGPDDGLLLRAEDLVGHAGIRRAPAAQVTYVQFLFRHHAIVAANGLLLESFHPAWLRPVRGDCRQRAEILSILPELDHGTDFYGPEVRQRAARQR